VSLLSACVFPLYLGGSFDGADDLFGGVVINPDPYLETSPGSQLANDIALRCWSPTSSMYIQYYPRRSSSGAGYLNTHFGALQPGRDPRTAICFPKARERTRCRVDLR